MRVELKSEPWALGMLAGMVPLRYIPTSLVFFHLSQISLLRPDHLESVVLSVPPKCWEYNCVQQETVCVKGIAGAGDLVQC